MLLENPEDGIDQLTLLTYLRDTGKLLTDTFFHQSVARKSFITSLMDKGVKPVLDAPKSDQWLNGEKFAEHVKDAKLIEKACNSIKGSTFKTPFALVQSQKQGNWRAPPVKTR